MGMEEKISSLVLFKTSNLHRTSQFFKNSKTQYTR